MQDLRTIAIDYFDGYGFGTCPMKGKEPQIKWKELTDRYIDHKFIESLSWNSGVNGLAVILGRDKLRGIDLDKVKDPEAVKKILHCLGLPEQYQWVVKSGSQSGNHIYFYADDDSQLLQMLGGEKTVYTLKPKDAESYNHAELRWKGCLMVLPPSLHASGHEYRFENCRNGGLPERPPVAIRTGRIIEMLRELFVLPEERKTEDDESKSKKKVRTEIPKITNALERKLEAATKAMAGKINNYEDWMRLGFAAASLGEDGREYFQKLSDGNSLYRDSLQAINRKFDQFLKDYRGDITIGSFLEIAKKYGYQITNDLFWRFVDGTAKILPDKMNELLQEKGFAKMLAGKECLFVHVDRKIIRECQIVEMKDFIIKYIEENAEAENREQIRRSLIRQASSLFSQAQLEFLPTIEPEIHRDTKEKAFFYLPNYYIEVNAAGCIRHEYSNMRGYVWKEQIITREIDIEQKAVSEYETFIMNVCKNDPARIKALKSAIGYLLHGYKDPSVPKCIIFTDEKLSEDAFGRSGKGLIVRGVMKMKKVLKLDMQNHSLDKSFPFQSVGYDTQIIWMDEVKKHFPFARLFSMLAEGLTIEKKNKNEFFIPYETAPKFVITSNFSISGRDDSALDRQFVIEFSDHYNMKYKPRDEFGHLFFDEWDATQWNAFYLFMMECCREFIKNGLQSYEYVNLKLKKLIDDTNNEFAEFILGIPMDKEYRRKDLYDEFMAEHSDFSQNEFKQNKFTRYMKNYCQIYELQCNERKSNKDYYVTLRREGPAVRRRLNGEIEGSYENDKGNAPTCAPGEPEPEKQDDLLPF